MANRMQRKGKLKTVPVNITPKNDVQLNLEVLWCIRQLEETLTMKKISTKQAQDATYSLNVLRSKTAPVIKKRQVMKAALGDYRSKMLEEEKKLEKAQEKAKLTAASPSTKSQFIKKSSSLNFKPTGNTFRFNFDMSSLEMEINQEENSLTSGGISEPSCNPTTNFRFIPSDNNFRFSFSQPAS